MQRRCSSPCASESASARFGLADLLTSYTRAPASLLATRAWPRMSHERRPWSLSTRETWLSRRCFLLAGDSVRERSGLPGLRIEADVARAAFGDPSVLDEGVVVNLD